MTQAHFYVVNAREQNSLNLHFILKSSEDPKVYKRQQICHANSMIKASSIPLTASELLMLKRNKFYNLKARLVLKSFHAHCSMISAIVDILLAKADR